MKNEAVVSAEVVYFVAYPVSRC